MFILRVNYINSEQYRYRLLGPDSCCRFLKSISIKEVVCLIKVEKTIIFRKINFAGQSAPVQSSRPRPDHALPRREGEELRRVRGDPRGPGRPGGIRVRGPRGCEPPAQEDARGPEPAQDQRLPQQSGAAVNLQEAVQQRGSGQVRP